MPKRANVGDVKTPAERGLFATWVVEVRNALDLTSEWVASETGCSVQYALNGSARDAGLPELDSTVWNGDRVATLGLIEQGLTLCP